MASPLEELPEDVVLNILSRLDAESVERVEEVLPLWGGSVRVLNEHPELKRMFQTEIVTRQGQEGFVTMVPTEVLSIIFELLDSRSMASAARVSTSWRNMARVAGQRVRRPDSLD
mmetsp:Transcript_4050/g.12172  ORF Transcript_4050/g.12172 Transcript_4050/m.12172 type:complete len:115 (+) Transcript_4050:194-538(+)